MTNNDELRAVLQRAVGGDPREAYRIEFENGEIFVVRNLSEVPSDGFEGSPDVIDTWSGEILAAERLSVDRAKRFRPGSGIDFSDADVVEVREERTSALLFSRRRR